MTLQINHPKISPVVLILLDGWGIAPPSPGNLLTNTSQPNLNGYLCQYPLTALTVPSAASNLAREAYRQIGSGQDSSIIPGLGGVVDQSGLTELLFKADCRQAYFSETEKLPLLMEHLAHNYHGQNIDYQVVSSPLNNNYNDHVLSSSQQLIDQAVRYWRQHQPDFLAINLAAWSSVARYGNLESVTKAIIAMDKLLPKLVNPINQAGATILLTSAYGRLEDLFDPFTEKIKFGPSSNPVPISIIGKLWQGQSLGESEIATDDLSSLPLTGSLRSITPTILMLLGVKRPSYLVDSLLPASFN